MQMANVWAVARVTTSREFFIAEQLKDYAIEHYLPRFRMPDNRNRARSLYRRRWRFHKRPLYPGYLFVEHASVSVLCDLATVLSDVLGVVMVGEEVATSPRLNADIAALKASEDANGFVPMPECVEAPTFKVGHLVLIKGGLFKGYTGKIEQVSTDGGAVSVALQMFGRQVPVPHSIDAVEAA
jgi:transcription antitermination factor NusG